MLVVLLLPTLREALGCSYFYVNVNQIIDDSGFIGQISLESYYAEDLMQELEEAEETRLYFD